MANSYQTYITENPQDPSFWLMPVTGSPEHPVPATGTFHSRETLIRPLELQELEVRGFSQQEIEAAEKTLRERNTTPSYNAISHFLSSESGTDASPLYHQFREAINQTSGVQGKIRLADELRKYSDMLKNQAKNNLDQHYASLWPDRDKIKTIVGGWPPPLVKQAEYIKTHWPELVVKGDMVFNFGSTSEVCFNDYGGYSKTPSPLGYLAFFRLIKDIWFDALMSKNLCTVNRVSHLLISFTKAISDNTIERKGGSRKEQFDNVIQRELEKGISSTYDIGAFAFLLVTNPPLWQGHKNETLKLLISRAFNNKEEQLAPLYSQWQDPDKQDQACKTVESKVIPKITIASLYLDSIYDYLMKYKLKGFLTRGTLEEIANGRYFDSTTNQLANPIKMPDWKTLPPIPGIKETLSQFYANPCHQKLFLGTEEFKAYQQEQRQLKARQRFTDAITNTTRQIKKKKAELIKKQFKEQGFAARKDSLGNISYGEAYYKKRKEYINYLKVQKLAVEQQIGVPVPFKATAAQLDLVLAAFKKLPTAEQRYWQMSPAYAESTAIPDLLGDLTLTEDSGPEDMLAHEHEKLLEQQSKFITCRCSECTICEATRYLCECRNGLKQRVTKRENKNREFMLKQNIIKNIEACYSKNYSTEGTSVPEKDKQTALPATQTPNRNKRKRTQLSGDCKKVSPSGSFAKVSRYEHTLNDESQCKKEHRPACMIDRLHRELVNEVLNKKFKVPETVKKRQRLSPKPAGQRKYDKVLSQLYKHHKHDTDKPLYKMSTTEILEWFAKNPKQAEAAINYLQGKPQLVKSLFTPGTLKFATPKTLAAIPCQVIYHDIESFNKHLNALATKKKNNFIPLDNKKVKGFYLHKTFCLACRTNFGQRRELQAHLQATHQATMDKTFADIRAMGYRSIDEPDTLDSPVENMEKIPFHQQSQEFSALFEHERV
ncbi:hypothetical protein [Endozoicomonas sp. GU-1]|uniref:hypothetical protein n=1 Tax=Endozoicomonas sp. GU-1 TaxID=3009078 RepID=UPI0022B5C7C9|nr:hypothetical protein [Endozoicomonas sp. GU-1]WBA81012.1 hypothetical protein O2T12_22355 [Endozoicomonas sp. GU-1]